MGRIMDFGEEKRARRKLALLEDLFLQAHQTLRNLHFSADGMFIVLKSPGPDGKPHYQFVQEGISGEEMADILRRIGLPLTLPK